MRPGVKRPLAVGAAQQTSRKVGSPSSLMWLHKSKALDWNKQVLSFRTVSGFNSYDTELQKKVEIYPPRDAHTKLRWSNSADIQIAVLLQKVRKFWSRGQKPKKKTIQTQDPAEVLKFGVYRPLQTHHFQTFHLVLAPPPCKVPKFQTITKKNKTARDRSIEATCSPLNEVWASFPGGVNVNVIQSTFWNGHSHPIKLLF